MAFLPEAFEQLARFTQPPVNRLFADTAELLLLGDVPIHEAWRQSIVRSREYLVLTQDDEEILLDLGDSLGISHREDQSRHLRLAQEALSRQEAEAQRAEEQLVRLYSMLGHAGGRWFSCWLSRQAGYLPQKPQSPDRLAELVEGERAGI